MYPTSSRLLTHNDKYLIFSSKLAFFLGSSEAVFLQQLHYWLTSKNTKIGNIINDQRWIYNTYEDWCNELKHYSERTIRRAINRLEDLNIISSRKFKSYQGNHTKWYTINYDILTEMFPEFSENTQNGQIKNKYQNIPPISFESQKRNKTSKNILISASIKCENFSKKLQNLESMRYGQNVQIIYRKQKYTNISSITSKKSLLTKLTGKLKAKNRQENKLVKMTSESSKISRETKNTESKITDVNKLNVAMKEIWERVVEGKNNPVYLTKKLCKFFMAAFKRKFNNSLEQWEAFCKKITTSAFLMGQSSTPFKASLEWALRFDVIDKIFNGHYGVKEAKQEAPLQTQERLEALEQQINSAPENAIVKSFRIGILKVVGVNIYSSWFKNTTVNEENNILSVTAASQFQTDYIHTHFAEVLKKIMDKSALSKIEFTVTA